MTKDELSSLFALNREIDHLHEQYRQARAQYDSTFKGDVLSDTVTGSSPEWPYCQHTMTIAGIPDATGHRGEYRKELAKTISQIWDMAQRRERERNRLLVYIDGIEDSEMRLILTLRYVDGLHWPEVAAKMGPDYSEDGVRKASERFLEKV